MFSIKDTNVFEHYQSYAFNKRPKPASSGNGIGNGSGGVVGVGVGSDGVRGDGTVQRQ